MINISEEVKTEFVKDVDASLNKCVIEIYNALIKMLIKACPEKAEELKAYVQKHKEKLITMFKDSLLKDGCDFEEIIRLFLTL